MTRSRLFLMTLASCATLVLAGCESDEDKAERFYQSGLALLAEGDQERAALELRNVFNHDGFHKDARMTYAGLMLDMGRIPEAYGQYLRLIEQYPDTVEARVALAKLALTQGNWPEVERHGTAALELAPDLPEVKAIDLANRYRAAAQENDTEKRAALAVEAEQMLTEVRAATKADNDALVRIVLDRYLTNEQPAEALRVVEGALSYNPTEEELNILKIRLLSQLKDVEGTGAHLQNMIQMFPDNLQIKQAMIQWFMSQGDVDGAEAFLRAEAGDDTAATTGHVQVIQLLRSTKGEDAARAELTRLQAANEGTENGRFYTGLLATIDFQAGEQDSAMDALRTAIAASEEGPQKVRLQVSLAEMLSATGADEDALALVDTVLETDSGNVRALQMRAANLIESDQIGDAIVALRTALDQQPRNAETLTLLAQAHQRDGDINLVGERLAMAMEASGNGVPEIIRYAGFLVSQDRLQVATTVLEDGLRRNLGNVELLAALANIHLRTNNWDDARAIAKTLATGTPQAQQIARELEARILQGEDRTDESVELLQRQLSESPEASANEKTRAIGLIVQTQIRSGKTAAARETLDAALAENPGNSDLQLINAALLVIEEKFDEAEAIYRDLMEKFPQSEVPVQMLVNTLIGTNRREEGRAVLEAALEAVPNRPNLLWMQASFLEQDRDFDGAIAIYEQLYALNSNSPVVANNLASMITTHRNDAESLTKAANIARRLRGTEVPAFQDTYGWIAYRRENYEEALEYLAPAAKGLPEDPLVQYHLGMTYLALNQVDQARAQLEKALEIAADSPLPQFEDARKALAGLE
ncbi:hypothetical protein AB838_18815 [Rhodobacteraceae bacterium (ex Bugula neritina AB1)]|nr:hypothetical protein AB838_18815 [Rhodobacteraceae bacterium (ex Bugula neritina AB1)]